MGDWRDQAACKGLTPLFFAEGIHETRSIGNAAKTVCATCPVQQPCLEEAIANHETDGIWGGLSVKERRRVARGLPARKEGSGRWSESKLKPCGTRAAYVRHRARDEEACAACKAAEVAYQRGRDEQGDVA